MAAATRKNTVVIDFSVLPVRPNPDKIEKFLDTIINLDYMHVKNLQLHNVRNCVLIEMASLAAAENLAALHHLKHSIVMKKQKYLIPVHMEDSAVNVRIHDLPPDMPNADVAKHMKQYGKVKSVARESWKKYFQGVPNGVRVVRMEVEKPIPSYIQINGEMTLVTYRTQIPTCRHCGQRVHPKQKCAEAAAERITQSNDPGSQLQPTETPLQQSNNAADNEAGRTTVQRKRGHSPGTQQKEDRISNMVNEMESDDTEGEFSSPEWLDCRSKKFDKRRAKKTNDINGTNTQL